MTSLDNGWRVTLHDHASNTDTDSEIDCKAIVNETGPWVAALSEQLTVSTIMKMQSLDRGSQPPTDVRFTALDRGSRPPTEGHRPQLRVTAPN
jgi:hypothetical protein